MPDLVVDSSVWIDYFNKKNSEQVEHLEKLLLATALVSPIIIFPVIMQEVLQGLVNDISFNTIKENLQGLEYLEYDAYKFAVEAAQLYRFLRRKGATVRKANDCLIAALCIDNDIPLFHKDKDFDNIAKYTSLKIYKIK
jgi:predicted nucleic acid-binding protein